MCVCVCVCVCVCFLSICFAYWSKAEQKMSPLHVIKWIPLSVCVCVSALYTLVSALKRVLNIKALVLFRVYL